MAYGMGYIDEVFGSDPEDELLYDAPGTNAITSYGSGMSGMSGMSNDRHGGQRTVEWIYGRVDRPRWRSGDDALGPKDYWVGGDITPRWLGLSPTPAVRSGWPRRDPPDGPVPGDVWDMDPCFGEGMGQLDANSVLRTVLGTAVQEVVFKSQLSPDVTYRPFAPPGQQQPAVQANPLTRAAMSFAKPAVYVRTPAGLVPLFEPYGRPENDYSGYVAFGATVLGLTAAWLAWKAAKKLAS